MSREDWGFKYLSYKMLCSGHFEVFSATRIERQGTHW
jgi:hypothetical protein